MEVEKLMSLTQHRRRPLNPLENRKALSSTTNASESARNISKTIGGKYLKDRTFQAKGDLHKHPSNNLVNNNYKEQAVVYGSLILFFSWLFTSIYISILLVVSCIVLAHILAAGSHFKKNYDSENANKLLRETFQSEVTVKKETEATEIASDDVKRPTMAPDKILEGL